MEQRPLPVGIDDFGKIIDNDYYYIDKTRFIKELLDKKGEVNLFTRPRRFGKSLNMSMLHYFFENKASGQKDYFEGLFINEAGEKYMVHKNAYPVIALTFKTVAGKNFVEALQELQTEIIHEFERHAHVLEQGNLSDFNKQHYEYILSQSVGRQRTVEELEKHVLSLKKDFIDSLEFLCRVLRKHYNKKVIVLIDEYDVPLESAYFNGYYQEMLPFLRSFFLKALKSNKDLEFAVLTGCLRVSKESIFTGLNNLHVLGIDSSAYGEYFGFTENEVKKTLNDYQLSEKETEIKRWYNGYLFGETVVYNPWSVIKYLFDLIAARENSGIAFPKPYWSNTSSNEIVRQLIELASEEEKTEVESLIQGKSIPKKIKGDIVYEEIDQSVDNLWNFLFFTGYLKKSTQSLIDNDVVMNLEIPNLEIKKIYEDKILEWFHQKIKLQNPREMIDAILTKNTAVLERELNERMMDLISFHDSQENFYHGFMVGLLSNLPGFDIKSNRESGNGRSDLYMKSKGISKQGIIFELKVIGDKDVPEKVCKSALQQISRKRYDYELESLGYRHILKYGIAFRGKECLVMAED